MGTPVSESHRQTIIRVVRGVTLTDEALLELLEDRRKAIAPHRGSFTFGRLGDLEIGDTNISTKPLSQWPSPPYGECDLTLQGVFGWSHELPPVYPRDRFVVRPRVGWGLLRIDHWLVITAKHEIESLSRSYPGKTRERVTEVLIQPVNAEGLLKAGVDLRRVFLDLGHAARIWADRREELYRQAQALASDFAAEDLVVENAIGVAPI